MKKLISSLLYILTICTISYPQDSVPTPIFEDKIPIPLFQEVVKSKSPLEEIIEKSTGRILWKMNNTEWSVGTGTVLLPRNADGSYNILTASHVVRNKDVIGGSSYAFVTIDKKEFKCHISIVNRQSDIAILVTNDKDLELDGVRLASKAFINGYVLHKGFGGRIFQRGKLTAAEDSNGLFTFKILCKRGDSGGGIFCEKSHEIVGVVSCGFENTDKTYGGSCFEARRILGVLNKKNSIPTPSIKLTPMLPSSVGNNYCSPGSFR